MKCEKCGHQNPRGARFCGYCHHELKEEKKLGLPIVFVLVAVVCTAVLCAVIGLSDKGKMQAPGGTTSVDAGERGAMAETPENTYKHSWRNATCTSPQICITCGATSGTTASHQWREATYDAPKTCAVCGTTTGSALNPLGKLSVGDKFEFGTYEQDGSSGNGAEDIEWVVLDKTADKILVISKYALDCQRYHRQNESVTWETCSVRTWLNSTFYNAAFGSDEKQQILTTKDSETSAKDKIFLLSIDELEEYFPSKHERICRATSYAIDQNAYVNPSTGGSWWLLRTEGESRKHVMSVNSDGKIDYEGGKVASDRGTVRPVMWLDISN